MILFFLILGLFVFLGLAAVFAIAVGKKQDRRNRFVSVISGGSLNVAGETKEKRLAKQRAAVAKKLKEASGEKKKDKISLRQRMQQAGIEAPVSKYWLYSVAFASVVGLLIMLTGFPTPAKFFIIFTAFLGIPKVFLRWKAARRQKKFLTDFPDALDGMGRLLQSGMPMTEAISMGAREYEGPLQEELIRVYDNQRIGIPLGEAALLMARRIPLPEVHMFATALQIQSETGSSLSEVLSNLSGVIRARFRLRRKVKALSSEAKSSAAIIAALPILVTLGLYAARPEYIGILFTVAKGKMLLSCAVIWMSFGILIMRQMINFRI